MNEEREKRVQGLLKELDKILDDAFMENIGVLVAKTTNDDHIPLDILGKLITNILFRRLNNTSERPIEVFSKAGVEALRSFGRPFKIEVAEVNGPDGELQSVSVTENIDGSKFLESIEQQCAEDKELCMKMIVLPAAAYGLKHPDEDIMVSIFQPAFEKLGMNVGIHVMTTLDADFTKDL